ncbi:hypothetical protein GCM10010446_04330 [Streptomyces enissocaesilis]|uniref:Lactate utilization protein C n=1 Tax=Streptomyces enissocaesilis TaxID=332589 RepID=A0ABP6J6T4_9ACTN
MTSSRDLVLTRVRAAIADTTPAADLPRDYLRTHTPDDPGVILDLLAENLTDYRAVVHRCTGAGLPALLARILAEQGAGSVAVPPGLPPRGWPPPTCGSGPTLPRSLRATSTGPTPS